MDDIINVKKQFPQSLKSIENSKNIGWLCTYTPEEMIIASGFNPLRVLGSKKLNKSESYFPINFCPYLKSSWEALLDSKDKLSGVIFTNSCDGMRRLYDTAEHYLEDMPVHMLDVPRNTDNRAKDFFASNLEDLEVFLNNLSGGNKKTEGLELFKAIELMNRKRTLLLDFSRLFFNGLTDLKISDYYGIMELATTSNIGEFIPEFERFMNSPGLEKKSGPKTSTGTDRADKNIPGVMIIGNLITEEKLWDMLSSMKLRLVSDDLCISSRYYSKLVNSGSPDRQGGNAEMEKDLLFRSLAERYLGKPQCMRVADMGSKINDIQKDVKENNVQGVIFISLKFCDTMLYSFPLIKQALGELKIPVLYLEIEYNNFSAGQVKTRTQAFLEML